MLFGWTADCEVGSSGFVFMDLLGRGVWLAIMLTFITSWLPSSVDLRYPFFLVHLCLLIYSLLSMIYDNCTQRQTVASHMDGWSECIDMTLFSFLLPPSVDIKVDLSQLNNKCIWCVWGVYQCVCILTCLSHKFVSMIWFTSSCKDMKKKGNVLACTNSV